MVDNLKLKEELKSIISEVFICSKDKIKDDTDLLTDLGGDSLDVVNIMVHIEKKYSFHVDDDENVIRFRTFDKIFEYVEKHMSNLK